MFEYIGKHRGFPASPYDTDYIGKHRGMRIIARIEGRDISFEEWAQNYWGRSK